MHPARLVFLCGTGASILGVAYLRLSGAPAIYPIINAGAVLIGLLFYTAKAVSLNHAKNAIAETWAIISAFILVLTAFYGVEIEGVKRWVAIGPLQLQSSIILVPFLTLIHARHPSRVTGLAICLAASALAMQPDRATAGALAAAALGQVVFQRSSTNILCAIVSLIAFCVTLLRLDDLPAVDFVEGVYQAAIASGVLDATLVFIGTALLLAPTLKTRQAPNVLIRVYSTFGLVWGVLIIAAFLGNYPTPLLGYGSSSIVGYMLCMFAFPSARSNEAAHASATNQ